jgi:hypothetical protein
MGLDMYRFDARKSFEKRTARRQKYSGHILFVTNEGLCEGELENFSHYGLFIKTRKPLPIGEIVTFAIPYSENVDYKRKGVVAWCNEEGFGVNLLEEDKHGYPNVIPFKSE